jgi:HEAT repeat protein
VFDPFGHILDVIENPASRSALIFVGRRIEKFESGSNTVMKRRYAIGLSAVMVCAIAGALLLFIFSERVPRHQGKDVYQWMLQQNSSALESNPGLMAIGSNAVPFLARALRTDKTMYDRYAWVQKPWFQQFVKRWNLSFTWRHSAETVRRYAAWSLLAFGFESKPALPELHAELLRTTNTHRQTIVHCLSEIGPTVESIPWLVKAFPLTTKETVVRHDLIHALGRGGTNAARLAMPLVISSLRDPHYDVRSVAAQALAQWRQPAPEAIPPLLSLLNGTNESAAMSAAMALGTITNHCDEATAGLQRLARSTNDFIRAVAAITAWRLGGDAEQARQTLEGLLASRKGRGAAADWLGELGAAAKPSVPALLSASQATLGAWVEMYDRAQCAKAVLRIQGESVEAYRVLEEAITSEKNSWIRGTVASEIGKLGAPARPLIPALRKALNDPDREVRHEAGVALERLEREGVKE